MIQQLLLFTTSIALGAVLGAIYFLLSLLAKSTKLKAMRYIFDVIWCAIAFTAFSALTMLLAGGSFYMFTLLGMIAGLGVSAMLLAKIKPKQKTNQPTQKPKKDTV